MLQQIPIFHFTAVESTNDSARNLLVGEDCVIVAADEQTKGRGRHGKIWSGTRGKNLYCSLGIRQFRNLTAQEAASYQAIGALAVADALRNIAPSNTFCIKYPNDVMALCPDGITRKISGILVEHDYIGAVTQTTIVGIGINVEQTEFPPEIAQSAVSLAILGCKTDVSDVFDALCESLNSRLSDKDIMENWRREMRIEGKRLTLRDGKESYTVQQILDDGSLLVDAGHENKIIYTGDSFRYDIDCNGGQIL
ncbi:biotin--[acetyl-CoA-carboxylase] ligase [Ignavibacteria bacterium]|nr:biotin--[acetyl-CoA-carboxylase] ligase [Bacteroidota bacterium]MCZ2131947.1 biotin--[acetyl-CoA-carboxylase] ligase [Bacteroidota bacterium]